jgi:hypothetical protein
MLTPDGWDSARFLELVLNFGSFPFPVLFLPSRTPQGHNAGRWALRRRQKLKAMKTSLQWVIFFTLFLAGCSASKAISTADRLPLPTQTVIVEFTSLPKTAIQPTSILASSATGTINSLLSACPSGNPELKPNFSQQITKDSPGLGEPILAFLNNGGTTQAVINALSWTDQQDLSPDLKYDDSIKNKDDFNKSHLFEQDLTGDGIPEFIVSRVNLYILGCRNQKYELLLQLNNDDWVNRVAAPWITAIDDLNSDGTPEIVVKSYYDMTGTAFRVFEWQGDQFYSLINAKSTSNYFTESDAIAIPMGELILANVDKNETKELIAQGYKLFPHGLPSRGEKYTYGWNRKNFVLLSKEFSKPIYRFEAVQDGDRYSLTGNYDKAISFYQDGIFSDKLDWWSSERNQYEVDCFSSKPNCPGFPVPPSPDPKEYYNLAAYSRFRIMVTYVLRGWLSDAETVYNELQKQFPPGQTGNAYAEMASRFWNEYQASENMEKACSKAIEYAKSNPTGVLSYLGNGDYALAYYGEQSLSYTAEDVCPFK